MNNDLYFIDSKRDDKFSLLKGIDLQDLIIQIENFCLSYRDELNLSKKLTFGIEIEYENVLKAKIDYYTKRNKVLMC